MGRIYNHLTAEERVALMVMRAEGASVRAIARHLGRQPSTISREFARSGAHLSCNDGDYEGADPPVAPYDAALADKRALALRQAPSQFPKLAPRQSRNSWRML